MRPMRSMLDAAQGAVRFHMPGHKGLLDPLDMTELAGTDDLYAPFAGIARAERLAALSCGAAQTLMLTGGSTAGLHAMILSCVAPGETLILPRNAHHAAVTACVFGGVEAVFAEDPLSCMDAVQAAAVLVTRPDYYGRCCDLEAIVRAARAKGMLVLVDEAHGAHFPWWDAPRSAGALGADAWVQSAHKTLPARTGAAWLHLSDAVDAHRARRFLRMAQTSSPPFPILESLDSARAWMDENGREALRALMREIEAFLRGLRSLEGYCHRAAEDPTRLVIGTRGRGYSGIEAQALLSAAGVEVEMADEAAVVCICTVWDTRDAFGSLYEALRAIPRRAPLPPVAQASLPPAGRRLLSVRDAVLLPQEAVPLPEAVGRVAGGSAGLYPPGIPLVLPGEQVTAACVEKLKALPNGRVFGLEDGCLPCVRCEYDAV